MRIEIFNFYETINVYFSFITGIFGILFQTEKWWSHGNEFVISIRFGKRVFEKRWK